MLLKFRFVFPKGQNYLNEILFSLNEGQMVYIGKSDQTSTHANFIRELISVRDELIASQLYVLTNWTKYNERTTSKKEEFI